MKLSGNHIFNKSRIIRSILFLFIATWCFGFSINIFFTGDEIKYAAVPVLHKIYSNVCHQEEAKMPGLAGGKLLVCSRCVGIYYGTFLVSFLSLFLFSTIKLDIKYLLFPTLLILADILFYNTGLYEYSKPLAFSTGLLFGSLTFIYILIALDEYILPEKTVKG